MLLKNHYHKWKLKINIQKFETILFRSRLQEANRNVRSHYKTFGIREDINKGPYIPHNDTVKYLGINIDERLHYNNHIKIQLEKAKKAFFHINVYFILNI